MSNGRNVFVFSFICIFYNVCQHQKYTKHGRWQRGRKIYTLKNKTGCKVDFGLVFKPSWISRWPPHQIKDGGYIKPKLVWQLVLYLCIFSMIVPPFCTTRSRIYDFPLWITIVNAEKVLLMLQLDKLCDLTILPSKKCGLSFQRSFG